MSFFIFYTSLCLTTVIFFSHKVAYSCFALWNRFQTSSCFNLSIYSLLSLFYTSAQKENKATTMTTTEVDQQLFLFQHFCKINSLKIFSNPFFTSFKFMSYNTMRKDTIFKAYFLQSEPGISTF